MAKFLTSNKRKEKNKRKKDGGSYYATEPHRRTLLHTFDGLEENVLNKGGSIFAVPGYNQGYGMVF